MKYPLKTGVIWDLSNRRRAQVVRRVNESLLKKYGEPRLGNPENPLDDLIFIILSNRTGPKVAERVYKSLKNEFESWDMVLSRSIEELRATLRPAGLSSIRSEQIYEALSRISKEAGSCTLNWLQGLPTNEALEYLTSLPGVSLKVAKCVMMYTLDARVLPVDSHVHRIAKRLGWISRKRADQSHEELEALVPPRWRYVFHVGCVEHGRKVCLSITPKCRICCISNHCRYYRNGGEFDG